MDTHLEALGFHTILKKLCEHALSQEAKDQLSALSPCLEEGVCRQSMDQTTAARRLLDGCGAPPLPVMTGLEEGLTLALAGGMLLPEALNAVSQFAVSCRRTAAYLLRGESLDQTVACYGRSLRDFTDLEEEIIRCVGHDRVHDEASPLLRSLRRKRDQLEGQIKEKLGHILQSRKQYLADGYITNRGGRYVLPVQRRYQSQFGGTVVEVSGKGSTVFMEPTAISRLQDELAALAVEEDGEVRRILYVLSALVADAAPGIRHDMELMVTLDVLFAKAKLSAAMRARPVSMGVRRCLDLRQGRHPLLDTGECVPLDLQLEEGQRGVVITGPNTGGKTVALKTVGLLTLMAQCGLHAPCEEGSYLPMQDGFWCDIGDSQSISQNLSTFSGHITNVITILAGASRDSLVLLDELGSGTDPAEGMGIAVAVLEELRRRGCLFLVTTHYSQVKTYAEGAQGVQSARMAFDRESLRPLYRLEMGKSGESCALDIAKRLGLPPHLLDRARRAVYEEELLPALEDESSVTPPPSRLRPLRLKQTADLSQKFTTGDSVLIPASRENGIVYRPADDKGMVVVQIKGEKRPVRHDRIQLQVAAAQLYPPDYDFSILFDTVDNRKARHKMSKGFRPDLTITHHDAHFDGS